MTNETKSKRGGEGRGQGRKPLTPTEPTVKVAITLLASQVEAMQQLGNGNLSAGIRKAIDTMNLQDFTILARAIYRELYGQTGDIRSRTEMITKIENWLVEGEDDHDDPDVQQLAQDFQRTQTA